VLVSTSRGVGLIIILNQDNVGKAELKSYLEKKAELLFEDFWGAEKNHFLNIHFWIQWNKLYSS
jgi:hypothetical protein